MDQMRYLTFEKEIDSRHLFLYGINAFHLLHLTVSEADEQIRNDTIAKQFT